MLVVSCPNCRVELDLEEADAGHLVECPACLHKFTAPGTPAPPPLPPVLPSAPPSPPAPPARDPEVVWVKCPACTGEVSVARDDLGHVVECPLCHQTFTPPEAERKRGSGWKRPRERDEDDRDGRRHRQAVYEEDDDYRSPKTVIRRAQQRLATPGGGLQVLGWIDVVTGVIGLIIGIAVLATSSSGEWVFGLLNAGPGVSGVILGGLKAFGGVAMKQARNRPLCVTAAVAGCIPLNISICLSWLLLPAYIVSIVFGIMAMTVLFKADVKKAFELTRPDGDADVAG